MLGNLTAAHQRLSCMWGAGSIPCKDRRFTWLCYYQLTCNLDFPLTSTPSLTKRSPFFLYTSEFHSCAISSVNNMFPVRPNRTASLTAAQQQAAVQRQAYLPGQPVAVLFVCLGNICRSTMAEGIFRHMAAQPQYKDKIGDIDSCGTGS